MQDQQDDQEQQPKSFLLHDDSLDQASLERAIAGKDIETRSWEDHESIPSGSRVLLYAGDRQIRELIPAAIERQWHIGVLNHPHARQMANALGVTDNLRRNIRHYLKCRATNVDVLTCNDELVLSAVAIGHSFSRNPFDIDQRPSRFDRIITALKAVRHLRLDGFRLTTGKGQKVQMAALGLLVTKNPRSGLLGDSFSEVISAADGRFTMIAVSPRSICSYLWLLIRILSPRKIDPARLPPAVGIMRNRETLLESDDDIEYLLDGKLKSASSIRLAISDQGMSLLPGPKRKTDVENPQKVDKDNIKVDHLPLDETAQMMLGEPLPFFSRAGEEEHRGLFVSLRASSTLSSSYLVLMFLSTLLALTGLYVNSAPVIIGAMILAPLMSPIVSLAMGLARTELQLIRNSLTTLAFGVGAGLFCAIALSWLMPYESLTPEMQSRISPTLLDLAIAVISGVAGAYAHAKEEIAKSLAGVAISVALVPPLSVAGIGIGWGEWEMARGASLLFVTNIIGISIAATVTFLVLGFAPFRRAQKGLVISLLFMALVSVPLYFTFQNMLERGRIIEQIPRGQFELAGLQVRLRDVTVFVRSTPLIRVGMSSSQRIDETHVEALKELISERIDRPIYLEAQFYLRR